MCQGQDPQEIQEKISTETKDQDLDLTDRETRITDTIIKMKEAGTIMNFKREIKRVTKSVMINMRTVISIIIRVEIIEGIKIGEINLVDLLRKSDFLLSINQCLPKKILKIIRM